MDPILEGAYASKLGDEVMSLCKQGVQPEQLQDKLVERLALLQTMNAYKAVDMEQLIRGCKRVIKSYASQAVPVPAPIALPVVQPVPQPVPLPQPVLPAVQVVEPEPVIEQEVPVKQEMVEVKVRKPVPTNFKLPSVLRDTLAQPMRASVPYVSRGKRFVAPDDEPRASYQPIRRQPGFRMSFPAGGMRIGVSEDEVVPARPQEEPKQEPEQLQEVVHEVPQEQVIVIDGKASEDTTLSKLQKLARQTGVTLQDAYKRYGPVIVQYAKQYNKSYNDAMDQLAMQIMNNPAVAANIIAQYMQTELARDIAFM